MFPCFDQPDLKGTYTLICFALPEWSVNSNEFEETVSRVGEGYSEDYIKHFGIHKVIFENAYTTPPLMHIFRRTAKFSPYLFVVMAGDFVKFEAGSPLMIRGKPGPYLRAFMRPEYEKMFAVTQEQFFQNAGSAITFMSELCDFPYPFSKLDSCFVPDFRYGGMENVGCIIYSEAYCYESSTSLYTLYILMHELSHHWFGDVVTMKWWNNLWLNEGFATFMGHYILAKAKGLEQFQEGAWEKFMGMKRSLFTRENYTSHSIIADQPTTENAESLIDCITYDKAGSVIKQIYYILGEEGFHFALQQYFKAFNFENTVPENLLRCIDEAAVKFNRKHLIDVNNWAIEWLHTAGSNSIKPELEIQEDKIKRFTILQKPDLSGIYRTHVICVALYYENFDCKYIEEIVVQAREKTEVLQIVGLTAPWAVFLNAKDYGHVDVELDQMSFDLFQGNVETMPESLTKKMIKNKCGTY